MSVTTKLQTAVAAGLSRGSFGAGGGFIKKLAKAMEQTLNQAVIEARGEVRLSDRHEINLALRCEMVALLAMQRVRNNAAGMTTETTLTYLKAILDATERRTKAVQRLQLNERDPFLDIPWPEVPSLAPPEPAADAGAEATPPDSDGAAQAGQDDPEHLAADSPADATLEGFSTMQPDEGDEA